MAKQVHIEKLSTKQRLMAKRFCFCQRAVKATLTGCLAWTTASRIGSGCRILEIFKVAIRRLWMATLVDIWLDIFNLIKLINSRTCAERKYLYVFYVCFLYVPISKLKNSYLIHVRIKLDTGEQNIYQTI